MADKSAAWEAAVAVNEAAKAEDLRAALYEALREGDPTAFYSAGMVSSGKGWVLSRDTWRGVVALLGGAWSGGYLIGLPYRVDDAVEGFSLEPLEAVS